jgi:hypothetical protein
MAGCSLPEIADISDRASLDVRVSHRILTFIAEGSPDKPFEGLLSLLSKILDMDLAACSVNTEYCHRGPGGISSPLFVRARFLCTSAVGEMAQILIAPL